MPENVINEGLMESYFNSDPTDFEEPPFHLITTNHPWMAELGLSSFTTGVLYRWWNERDGEGNSPNQDYFDLPVSDDPSDLLLGTIDISTKGKDSDEGRDWMAFQAWRKEDRAGKYETFYSDSPKIGHPGWTFNQPGTNEANNTTSYTYNDLNVNEFNDTFIESFDEDGKAVFPEENDLGYPSYEIPDGRGGKEQVTFYAINDVTQIICLNQWVNNYQDQVIDKSTWSQSDFARSEFILDIQSSKEGYVEWSGYVPFQISLGSGDAGDVFKCTKADWVKFRLHLYPNGATKSTRRGVAMAKPLFAAPPIDSLGRKYQNRDDGRFSAFPEGSRVAEVAGELEMTYNEYTGKWEAGSQQMVAVVNQTISAAQQVPVEKLRATPPEEALKNPQDPDSLVVWGSGSALPLSMQNGNPMQWTPNYAQSSETDSDGKFTIICPEESEEKAHLKVFNASSKELITDQYVLLNKIDGLWFAMDFPSGIEQFTETQAGFDGLWDFYYCATNAVHYFRDSGFKLLDADDIEKGFHKDFYANDPDNYEIYENTKSLASGGAEGGRLLIPGGYHQFTSFDMMDNKIGGTREDGNKYAVTDPLVGPNGEITDGEANGETTGAFFGCIFPDGYNSSDISEYRSNRNFVAMPTVATSGLKDDGNEGVGRWVAAGVSTDVGGVDFKYFYDEGIDTGVKPFNDGADRNLWKLFRNEDNEPVAMFTDDDTSLTNLPADIALNASPLGAENGQPLTNLHMIERMYINPSYQGGVHAEIQADARQTVRDVFSFGRNWLYKKVGEGVDGNNQDFTESNAFDFKPKKNNRIMFRPLKAEVYAQFGEVEYDADRLATGRQRFIQSCAEKSSLTRPSSSTAYQREFVWDKSLGIEFIFDGVGESTLNDVKGTTYPIYNSHWGLQMNIDIPRSPTDSFKLSPKASLMVTNNRFHWNTWGRGTSDFTALKWVYGVHYDPPENHAGLNYPWRGQSDPFSSSFGQTQKDYYEGGGAVGIIGAVATCTANTNIRTNATCRLGIWSWSTFDNVQGGKYWPAWGKGNSYRGFNTTNLFVKVYHQWPREQTIYDPRYFAVHHFNAGILDETVSAESDNYKIYKTIEKLAQKDPTDPNGGSRFYNYSIDQLKYEGLDLRVPSSKVKTGLVTDDEDFIHEPNTLSIGSRMYGTRSYDGESEYGETTYSFEVTSICEWLDRSRWNIDPKRRGKLLPYYYKYNTVRIPRFFVELPDYDDGVDDEGNEFIYANGGYAVIRKDTIHSRDISDRNGDKTPILDTKVEAFYDIDWKPDGEQYRTFDPLKNPDTEDVLMIIRSPGKGEKGKYAKNDTFVTPFKLGNPAMILVNEVDAEGRIKKFFVYDMGDDFGNTGFTDVDEDRPISRSSTGISLANGGDKETENGSGFSAYIVRGEVFSHYATDEKPKIATGSETTRLSIKSNSDSIQEGQGAMPFGLETGEELQDILIETKSSGNKYDLFFHFHNDISHTLLQYDWRGSTDRYNNDEQYIDIEITTN